MGEWGGCIRPCDGRRALSVLEGPAILLYVDFRLHSKLGKKNKTHNLEKMRFSEKLNFALIAPMSQESTGSEE